MLRVWNTIPEVPGQLKAAFSPQVTPAPKAPEGFRSHRVVLTGVLHSQHSYRVIYLNMILTAIWPPLYIYIYTYTWEDA